jgi:hypothetical protein
MPGYYVKMIGASDLPLANDPFVQIPSLAYLVRFPRDQFPRDMKKGDELLYYAVGGYKKLFAQVRLTDDPKRDVPTGAPERGIPNAEIVRRWPHAAPVERGPHVDYVEFGPDLWDINPRLMDEIHQGVSHFAITSTDFDKGVRLINKGKQAQVQARRMPWLSRIVASADGAWLVPIYLVCLGRQDLLGLEVQANRVRRSRSGCRRPCLEGTIQVWLHERERFDSSRTCDAFRGVADTCLLGRGAGGDAAHACRPAKCVVEANRPFAIG